MLGVVAVHLAGLDPVVKSQKAFKGYAQLLSAVRMTDEFEDMAFTAAVLIMCTVGRHGAGLPPVTAAAAKRCSPLTRELLECIEVAAPPD